MSKEYSVQASMKSNMRGCEAMITPDNKIILPSAYPSEHYYLYDPKTNIWESKARPYGYNVGWEFQPFDSHGTLHIVGGMSLKKHITCEWDTKQWKNDNAECPKGIICGGMVCGPNDKLYIFGGSDCANYSNILEDMYIYDIQTNSWTKGPSMPHKRCQFGYVNTGKQIIVIGGGTSYYSDYSPMFDTIFVFDFSSQTWTEIECKLPNGNRD